MKPNLETSAIDLIEESISFLRSAGFPYLAFYWIGTIPFALEFLFFWSDMAQDAYGESRLFSHALALTLLYGWMKFWQTVFVRQIRYAFLNQNPPPWTWSQKLWTYCFQGFLQPTQWILLPLSKLLVFPFGFAHAFYETLHVVGDGETPSLRENIQRAWKLSTDAPKQNHLLIWLISPWMLVFGFVMLLACLVIVPFIRPEMKDIPMESVQSLWLAFIAMIIPISPIGVLLFANVALILAGLPYLLQSLFGMDSFWTWGSHSFTDPFFMVVCITITFLLMDPMLKTAYTLRDFYGRSRLTGEDLLLKLKKPSSLVLLMGFLLLNPFPCYAEIVPNPTPAETGEKIREAPQRFHQVLKEVSQQREFTWRMERRPAREIPADPNSPLTKFWNNCVDWGKALYTWLEDLKDSLFRSKSTPGEAGDTQTESASITRWVLTLSLILLAIGAIIFAILFFRRKRRQTPSQEIPATSLPDLESATTQATDLPVGEWERLALNLMEKGDTRLATRAWYLSGLALLHEQGWIRVKRGKSNFDYLRETNRQSHVRPEIPHRFTDATSIFERVWYGFSSTTEEEPRALQSWVNSLRGGSR